MSVVRRAALVLAAALACGAARAAPLDAQDGGLRAAARVSPDTVQVGEPFTIGVVVTGADDLRFPPLLDAGDAWEQLEIARTEQSGGEQRAYYRLVAWEAGELELPALELEAGTEGATRVVRLPAPHVRSVLPAGEQQPELRGPRGLIGSQFPWLLLLLLAALVAGIAWWWWRRVRARRAASAIPEGAPDVAAHPAARAREALVALRREAEAGALGAPAFYDRLEEILREYMGQTRAWPPTRPVRGAPELLRGDMRDLHRHAVVSRFGGVEANGSRLLADADRSLTWLDGDAA